MKCWSKRLSRYPSLTIKNVRSVASLEITYLRAMAKQWVARRRLLGPLFLPQAIDRYREIVLRQAAGVFDRL